MSRYFFVILIMGKFETTISEKIKLWIGNQKIFFVSTAPLSAEGHINCSPKGLDSFRIIDEKTVVYEDLTGSGAETIAHVKENKRIVIMFCAFDGPPLIVRLYGEGEIITKNDTEFSTIQQLFTPRSGVRSYIKIHLTRVSDSCGYSVPLYEFKEDRDVLDKWFDRKGDDGLIDYQKENNQESIDGLRALDF